MHASQTTTFCLSILWIALSTLPSSGQTPAPAANLQFLIPLADSTQAAALLLPMPDSRLQLVYATTNGKLGLWTLTPTSPTPTPPPIDPPPVDPPKPTTGLALITISADTPATIPAEVSAALAATRSSFFAFTVSMVADQTPPPNALIWIGKSAGKTYPWTFLAAPDGTTLWQGPTPKTVAAFLEILRPAASPIAVKPICPTNTCPLQLKPPK